MPQLVAQALMKLHGVAGWRGPVRSVSEKQGKMAARLRLWEQERQPTLAAPPHQIWRGSRRSRLGLPSHGGPKGGSNPSNTLGDLPWASSFQDGRVDDVALEPHDGNPP